MRDYRFVRWLVLLGFLLLVVPQPASATRTVFDTWGDFTLSGYCSPDSSCTPISTPFSVQMDGNTYNSFYVNSNGTVSFGSIQPYLAVENSFSGNFGYTGPPPQTSLGAYPVPVFSPNFLDGPGYLQREMHPFGFDGSFAALTSVGSNSFTVNWFPCGSGYPLDCGLLSINLVASARYNPADPSILFGFYDLQVIIMDNASCPCTSPQQAFASGQANILARMMNNLPVYTMTLTDLPNGFRVDYSYNAAAMGQTGVYGFSLPSGINQITGPLGDRSYLFNPVGHWRQRGGGSDAISQLDPVPEPSTWMMMLIGFVAMGFAIRQRRPLQAA